MRPCELVTPIWPKTEAALLDNRAAWPEKGRSPDEPSSQSPFRAKNCLIRWGFPTLQSDDSYETSSLKDGRSIRGFGGAVNALMFIWKANFDEALFITGDAVTLLSFI